MSESIKPPCIVAEKISKVFPGGHSALRGMSCTIRTGERIAIVGANGAGKSTALRLLNLSYRPSAGRILWNGVDTAALDAEALRRIRSRIGTVPQKYDLIPQLTVRANVLTARLGRHSMLESCWSMFSERDTAEVQRVLGVVGIHHLIDERCDRLSGGEQQRAAIARALFQEPEVLFADEPLAAVDPAGAVKLMELLVEICVAAGRTLIMTSHHLHLFKDYFPRVIGLRQGELFFDAKAEDLSPRTLSALYGTDGGIRKTTAAQVRISAPRQTLRIGASALGCESIVCNLLPQLARMHPDLKLRVFTEDDAELAKEIEDGAIDIAFVLKGRATETLGLIPVRDERVVLVTARPSKGQALTPEQVGELTLLWTDSNHPVSRHVLEVLEKKSVRLNDSARSIELDSIASVRTAVINGLGCAFIPRALVSADLTAGALHEIEVTGLDVRYPIFALRRQGAEAAELIDQVVELAADDRIRAAV